MRKQKAVRFGAAVIKYAVYAISLSALFVILAMFILGDRLAPVTRSTVSEQEVLTEYLQRIGAAQEQHYRLEGVFTPTLPSFPPDNYRPDFRIFPGVSDSQSWSAVAISESGRICEVHVFSRPTLRREVKCPLKRLLTTQALGPVDSMIQRLPWAGAAFNVPKRMKVDSRYTVALVLDPQRGPREPTVSVKLEPEDAESLVATVIDLTGPTTDSVRVVPIRYSPRMSANLTGEAFTIVSSSTGVVAVSSSEPTMWEWQVTPARSGTQLLTLTLDAVLIIDGKETPRRFGVLREHIEVEVTTWQQVAGFVGRNWQTLLPLIGLPTLGAILVWLKRKWKDRQRKPDRPIGFRP